MQDEENLANLKWDILVSLIHKPLLGSPAVTKNILSDKQKENYSAYYNFTL